jgi:hypothetical protein
MSAPLTKHTTDHSDRESFSFSFFCDICGKEWRSPAVPFESGGMTTIEHEEARQMIWANERKIAFEQANLDARMEFNLCPICGNRVCDECFIFDRDLCKKCKGNEG